MVAYRNFIFILIIIPVVNLKAVSWAFLPVKFNGNSQNHIPNGMQINPDDGESGWQMAQLMRIYAKANYINTVLPMDSVKRVYKKNNIGYNADLTAKDLKTLAHDLDCDKIIITEIFFSKSSVRVDTRIFFTKSGTISDINALSGENFLETLGRSLRQRFQFTANPYLLKDDRYQYTFALDASGKNYNEIQLLPNLVGEMDMESAAGVSVDGYGKISILNTTQDKSTLIEYLNQIKPQSTDTTDRLYFHLLDSVMAIMEKGKNADKKKIVILLVSSAPRQANSRQKVNGFMRKLSRISKILILGNGKLSQDERNYWSLMTTGNSNIFYKDILYKQKIGLSDGNQVYLLKSGNKLLESNSGQIEFSHEIFYDKEYLKNFNQDNIGKIYESSTQKTVVSHGKPEIVYNLSLLSNILSKPAVSDKTKHVKLLVLLENKPFWINVPYASVVDEKEQKFAITEGESYYFLINLARPARGMPFRNFPEFASIMTPSEVSKFLILNMDRYLKNPENFLDKSIGGTSLYLIHGKIKDIQVEQERIY